MAVSVSRKPQPGRCCRRSS
uniref:SP110 nuclear body protein variant 12 n=1 Tax=Sus scrofa TaxID=9823 RepID=S5A8K9_PIG|nr:SP110 nuclear body protein variant 12 [Sus scrofa]